MKLGELRKLIAEEARKALSEERTRRFIASVLESAGTDGHDEDEDEDEETLNEDDDFLEEDKNFGGSQVITNPWADSQSVNKKGHSPKPKAKSIPKD